MQSELTGTAFGSLRIGLPVAALCWLVIALLAAKFGLHALWMFPLLVFFVGAVVQPVVMPVERGGQ